MASTEELGLRLQVLDICPNGITTHVRVTNQVEGTDKGDAQDTFEDGIAKNLEAKLNMKCDEKFCADGCKCDFDYVLGIITSQELRSPGQKTKKHNVTIEKGLWEFSCLVAVGCWCVGEV